MKQIKVKSSEHNILLNRETKYFKSSGGRKVNIAITENKKEDVRRNQSIHVSYTEKTRKLGTKTIRRG